MERETDENQGIDVSRYSKYMSIVVATIALANPIELVKSRMQTSPEHMAKGSIKQPYVSVLQTTRRIVAQEGFKGLWKGVGYFVLRTVPSNMGVFTVKEIIHRKLTKFVKHANPESSLRNFVSNHYFVVNSTIGGLAGFLIQILIYPFDYFRIIISNEIKSHPGSGIMKCIKEAMHHRGILGIFNGITMNLIYMTTARGLYFGIFDTFKNDMPNEYLKFLWSYFSIGTSLLVNYPLDTVRKRVILSPKRYLNGRECFRYIWRNEGVLDFFSGWRIISIQATTFSILFYLYDRMFTEIFRGGAGQK